MQVDVDNSEWTAIQSPENSRCNDTYFDLCTLTSRAGQNYSGTFCSTTLEHIKGAVYYKPRMCNVLCRKSSEGRENLGVGLGHDTAMKIT
jgi:hypothetical protein